MSLHSRREKVIKIIILIQIIIIQMKIIQVSSDEK